MTIRTRLTLWYAGILLVFSLALAGFSYYQLVIDRKNSTRDENEGFGDAIQMLLFCGAPAALIGVGGGWILTRKFFSPISAITEAASKIHDKNLHQRLPRSGNGDELDRLAEVFNSMIARLENSFRQIREFTLHASHELKTPLAIMNGELESALQDKNFSLSQRERVASQMEEIQRLAKIVDGLSLLTKAGGGQLQLQRETLKLHEIVRDVFEDAQILAQAARVSISLDTCEEIAICGDRHRIRQLLLNLIDNAIKYNIPNGKVTIQLRRNENALAELAVSNTGIGIPAEQLPRVFEPFFRGARNNVVEGCGLGLSICQLIVAAHNGTIELRSQPNVLTTVTVKFPIEPLNTKILKN